MHQPGLWILAAYRQRRGDLREKDRAKALSRLAKQLATLFQSLQTLLLRRTIIGVAREYLRSDPLMTLFVGEQGVAIYRRGLRIDGRDPFDERFRGPGEK